MTNFWYDCEFLEDGRTIEPISIGIVAEDGREYYAVFEEIGEGNRYERICKHDWLMENVIPHLPLEEGDGLPKPHGRLRSGGWFHLDRDSLLVLPKSVIMKQVREFLLGPNEPVNLWAYYGAYDHIMLSQLFGRMIDRPDGLPMWTNDVQQLAHQLGLEGQLPAQEGTAHNALDDARWTREAWTFLEHMRTRTKTFG